MNELSNYIGNYFDVNSEKSQKIATYFKPETLKRNEFHTEFGSRHGKMSFIKSGYLRIFKHADSKEVTQWISSPDEFVTDLNSLMFSQTARFNIQALTDVELFTINYSDYQRIQHEIEDWPQIEKLFLAKCFMTIEDRVFSFISMTAEDRYQFLIEYKPELLQKVPQQFIASMIGMTPETLSRVRRKIIS